jgi:hypothetical protein
MLSYRPFFPSSTSVLAFIPASTRDFPVSPRIQQTPCFSYQRSHSTELTKSSHLPRNSPQTHLCSILPNSRAPTSGVKIPLIRSGSIFHSRLSVREKARSFARWRPKVSRRPLPSTSIVCYLLLYQTTLERNNCYTPLESRTN